MQQIAWFNKGLSFLFSLHNMSIKYMYFLIVSLINLFRQSFVASREKDAFNKKLKMVLGETYISLGYILDKIGKAIRHLYTNDPPPLLSLIPNVPPINVY